MSVKLESVASKFVFPSDGGLFAILGPAQCGKSSLLENISLLIKSDINLKTIEKDIQDFLGKPHGLCRIVFDEINARFYKTGFFKSLCNTCKQNNVQLFIISQHMRDLPPLTRSRIDYWFLFKLDNNYLGFPPLNQLNGWVEPEHDAQTAIVAQFSENAKPEIWWYSKNPPRVERKSLGGPILNQTSITDLQDENPHSRMAQRLSRRAERNLPTSVISRTDQDVERNLPQRVVPRTDQDVERNLPQRVVPRTDQDVERNLPQRVVQDVERRGDAEVLSAVSQMYTALVKRFDALEMQLKKIEKKVDDFGYEDS